MTKTKDVQMVCDPLMRNDPELREMLGRDTLHAHVARMIYTVRTQAGLTQQALAELIGTQQPVIARLEDVDYTGHSLSMLQRIATALNRRVEIQLVPTTHPPA